MKLMTTTLRRTVAAASKTIQTFKSPALIRLKMSGGEDLITADCSPSEGKATEDDYSSSPPSTPTVAAAAAPPTSSAVFSLFPRRRREATVNRRGSKKGRSSSPSCAAPRTWIRSLMSSDRIRLVLFSYLDVGSKKQCRLVCRRWRVLVDRTLSFRIELTDFTHTYVENFGPTRPVRELLVGFLSVPYPPEGWNLHRVQSLCILSDYRFEVTYRPNPKLVDHNGREIVKQVNGVSQNQQQQPSLAMVVMSEPKLQRLFNEFRHVRTLTVSSMALADVKEHSFLASVNLKLLKEIHVSQEWEHGLVGVRDLLSNMFPRLRSASLLINCDDDLTLYAELFKFVGRHRETVGSLRLSFLRASLSHHADPNNNESDGTQIVNLNKEHKLDHVDHADLLKQLAAVRLRELELHALSTEGLLRNNLELQLLSSQEGLVRLHLTNLRHENMPVWRRVPLVIEACSRTLKHIILDGCFCECEALGNNNNNRPGPFPGSWVRSCRRLETLEVLVCGIRVKGILRIPATVKKLCLGHVLTKGQVKTVLSVFKHLEELSLPQSHVRIGGVGADQEEEMTATSSQSRTVESTSTSSATSPDVSKGQQQQQRGSVSKPVKVTLTHFKSALSLPSLRKLSLLTKTCGYQGIRRFASGLIGVVENAVEVPQVSHHQQQIKAGALKRGDVEFIIDRSVFSSPDEEEEDEDEEEEDNNDTRDSSAGSSKTNTAAAAAAAAAADS